MTRSGLFGGRARAEGGAVWVVGGVKSSELTSAPARHALSLVDHRTMSALIGQQRWSVAPDWWREGRPSPCSLGLSYKAHEQLQHLHKIFERTAACTYEKESSHSLRIALITVPSLILTLALLAIIMWSIFNTVFIFLVRSMTLVYVRHLNVLSLCRPLAAFCWPRPQSWKGGRHRQAPSARPARTGRPSRR